MKRIILPIGFICLVAAIFAMSVNADSTITIPIPEKAIEGKQVTLSLRIPPNTDPLTRKTAPKITSRSATYLWDANPSPKLASNDEAVLIFRKFNNKGWVKGNSAKGIINMSNMDKIYAIRVLDHIIDNVLDVAQAPNFIRAIRKINLESTDIDDLRRMVARFSKDLIMFGKNVKKVDKDLLMIQEQLKKGKSGVLKVIKVEGAGDGSTIIHLNVD